MTITILLADDHTILIRGLNALLKAEPDLKVVGEASTGMETLEKSRKLRPDVVVLDISLPDLNGLEVARQLCQQDHPPQIVILSMHSREPYVLEALRSGANAYVLKGSEADELIMAIRHVAQGRRYLSSALSERAIQAYLEKTKSQDLDPFETLTNREHQVIVYAAHGMSNNEIAEQLSISARTVETFRAKAMNKLNLHSQVELIRYAIQSGIIPLEDNYDPPKNKS
jgi:two-component system, NarL family, response regulator NreC